MGKGHNFTVSQGRRTNIGCFDVLSSKMAFNFQIQGFYYDVITGNMESFVTL